jgi:hypothetical protein
VSTFVDPVVAGDMEGSVIVTVTVWDEPKVTLLKTGDDCDELPLANVAAATPEGNDATTDQEYTRLAVNGKVDGKTGAGNWGVVEFVITTAAESAAGTV